MTLNFLDLDSLKNSRIVLKNLYFCQNIVTFQDTFNNKMHIEPILSR